MVRNVIVLALTTCLMAAVPAYCQDQKPNADSFRLRISAPSGWASYSGQRPPHRFGGHLLGAWQKTLKNGTAIIYVVGARRNSPATTSSVADSFGAFLRSVGVKHERFENFEVISRPAVKFTMEGQGDGQVIAALTEGRSASQPTQMEVVFAANPWVDGKGTDIIQFITVSHKADRAAAAEAFKPAVHRSFLQGKHDPSKPGKPAGPSAPASAAGGGDEDIAVQIDGWPDAPPPMVVPPSGPARIIPRGAVSPDDVRIATTTDAVTGSATSDAASLPAAVQTPAAALTPGATLFAAAVDTSVSPPRSVVIQFLASQANGEKPAWTVDSKTATDVYVLVWPEMRNAWVIPAADLPKLGKPEGDSRVVEFSTDLAPYLSAWSNLLGSR